MNPLLAQFITESRDLLEQASFGLLALEQTPEDSSHLDAVFRAVHTIKGSSGLFDIAPFTRTMHAGEDLLDAVRAGDAPFTPELADLLLELLDQVADWVGELEAQEALGPDAEERGAALTTQLRGLLDDAPVAVDATPTAAPAPAAAPVVVAAARAPQIDLPDHLLEDCERAQLVTYHPAEHCFFSGADPLRTAMTTPGLVWLDVLDPPETPLSEVDPFVAQTGFRAVTDATVDEINAHYLYVQDQITIEELDTSPSAPGTPEEPDRPPVLAACFDAGSSDTALAVDLIAAQKRLIATEGPEELRPARLSSARTVLTRIAQKLNRRNLAATLEALDTSEPDAAATLERLASNLSDSFAPPTQTLQQHAPPARADTPQSPAPATPPAAPAAPAPKATQTPPPEPAAAAPDPAEEAAPQASAKKSTAIRVDSDRIDQLMNLVGELIVAKNALPFLVRRAEELTEARGLARDIKAQHDAINRIADELQTSVMQIRMVPVGTVLSRFNRLVRDLSRKLDKRIILTIEGEETEADKAVVEELSDPMVHLIRNAIDHGLETVADRRAAGKSEDGHLRLSASQRDDSVVIEIADDGRGIDVQKVKDKARAAGLLDPAVLDEMSDEAALQLILAPGLSTKDEISDLSGRGVGMDVVASMVRRVGGTIAISSTPGKGTTVRVSLPLSMAVQRLMMVEVDGGLYGVSVDSVVESQRLPIDRIHRHRTDEMVLLRNRMIPLLRLRSLFGCPEEPPKEDINVMVVDVDGNEVGLVVDKFHAGVDAIVKPMEGVLNGVGCFSGTALLGDGSVLLSLDLAEVLTCRWT